MRKQMKTIAMIAFLLGALNLTPGRVRADSDETKGSGYDTRSPISMIKAVAEACGGIDLLKSLKDVEYEYSYLSADGTREISVERYIFDGEISWARYGVHETNVSPDLKGDIVQFYDGKSTSVYHNGAPLMDPQAVGVGQFLRQANYMWFTMMFKLTDPGTIHTFEGQEMVDGVQYDVVKVTYDPKVTKKEQNDTYLLYINPATHMVDRFMFSLPAFGVMEPALHAQLTYERIDGIGVITARSMSGPAPDGSGMAPLVEQTLKNIKFNNGFTREQLRRDR